MRHRKNYRKLNRATDQRIALLRAEVMALFRHNQIKTTLCKAKEARRLAGLRGPGWRQCVREA